MEIYPFSQSELEKTGAAFLPAFLRDSEGAIADARKTPSPETREIYARRIVRGGFPLAVFRKENARNRWFDDYVRQIVERDIPGIARIRNKDK
jgi:predicted AAA+ superfamily ATPase